MGKRGIIFLLIFLLIGWIAGNSYWYVCKIRKNCGDCEPITEIQDTIDPILIKMEKPLFTISDGESFSISNNQNISFSRGKSEITVPDSFSSDFAKLAEFLNNNDQKTLNIEGLFSKSEPSNSKIALERSESLKSFLITNYGVNSEKITTSSQEVQELYTEDNTTIGALSYSIVSPELIDEDTTEIIVETIEPIEEPVTSATETNHSNVDAAVLRKVKRKYTMYYAPNSDYVNTTSEMERYFKYLTKYFKQNPEGIIEIKGYSDADYDIKSVGREKAEMVKRYLIKEHKMNPRNLRTKGSSSQSPQSDDLDKARNRKVIFSLIK